MKKIYRAREDEEAGLVRFIPVTRAATHYRIEHALDDVGLLVVVNGKWSLKSAERTVCLDAADPDEAFEEAAEYLDDWLDCGTEFSIENYTERQSEITL